MKKSRISIISSILIVAGCSGTGQLEWDKEYTLPDSIFEDALELDAEIIELSDSLYRATEFYVVRDSILVVVNDATSEVPYVEFYRMGYFDDRIAGYFLKGNGSLEMLSVNTYLSGKALDVVDLTKNVYSSIDIDAVLADPDYFPEEPVDMPSGAYSPFITHFSSDSLILWNPDSCYDEINDIGNKGVARFGFLRQGDNPENFFGNNRYYMFNVNQGFLIVNKTKNRIIWAPSFYQGLEIYDCKQRPLIKINAPGNMPFKYKVPYGNLVAFDSKIPFTYRNFCTESDSFFVTYVGDYMVNGDETKNFDSYIFRFDWNGNLLNVYHSPVYLGTLTRSSDGKYFYGRGLDSSGTIVLYRLSCL